MAIKLSSTLVAKHFIQTSIHFTFNSTLHHVSKFEMPKVEKIKVKVLDQSPLKGAGDKKMTSIEQTWERTEIPQNNKWTVDTTRVDV